MFGLKTPEGTEMTKKFDYLWQSSFIRQASFILWVSVPVGGDEISANYQQKGEIYFLTHSFQPSYFYLIIVQCNMQPPLFGVFVFWSYNWWEFNDSADLTGNGMLTDQNTSRKIISWAWTLDNFGMEILRGSEIPWSFLAGTWDAVMMVPWDPAVPRKKYCDSESQRLCSIALENYFLMLTLESFCLDLQVKFQMMMVSL